MNTQQYLAQVRQYSQLSQRKHKSYAPVVDALTEEYISSQHWQPDHAEEGRADVEAMRDREYNPLYRGFPLSRPTE